MNHSDVRALLSAHANGELRRTQREFVEAHLGSCADCRATLAEHAWVRSRVTSLRATPIGPDIRDATMLKIDAIGTMKRPVQGLMRPALAAAAVVVAAIAVSLVLQLSGATPGGPIARAYAATAGLQSYRMTGSTTYTGNGQSAEGAFEWAFAAPDRYRGKLTTEDDIQEFIIVGDQQYARDSGSGRSRGTAFVITNSLFSPIPSREGTLRLLDSLTELEQLPDEKIDGIEVLHYRGRVDIDRILDEQLAGIEPESLEYEATAEALDVQRAISIEVELWIDKEKYWIRQMRQDVRAPTTVSDAEGTRQAGSAGYSTVVRYSGFDEPTEIEPPITASGELLPGWSLASHGPADPVVEMEAVTSESD